MLLLCVRPRSGPGGYDLPTGVRHCGESSQLPRRQHLDKHERETLWEIANALCSMLLKDYEAGRRKYANNP